MKKTIPAGAGEIMQYIVHAFNDNTIRFVLRYPFPVREDALRQAVFALVSSVDVLHASFVPGHKSAHWQINEVQMDQCFEFVQTQDDPMSFAQTAALRAIAPDAPAMLRCILVHGKSESAVAVLISHLCADGRDGTYLIEKLCEAYQLFVCQGNCRALCVKNGSRAAEQAYQHLHAKERQKLLRDPRTGIKSFFPFPSADAGEKIVLRKNISAHTIAAARKKLKTMGATVNDLLLAACYHAYVQTTGTDMHSPVSIMSMMDLRRHCRNGDSQGLCNMTGALATALPGGLGDTFTQTLSSIAQQTRAQKNDPYAGLYGMPLLHGAAKHLPLNLLLTAAGRLYGSMAIGMTNIGKLDEQLLQLDGFAPTDGCFGGPVKKKPGVQLSISSLKDAFALCIWGYATPEEAKLLWQLLDNTAQCVERFAHTEE